MIRKFILFVCLFVSASSCWAADWMLVTTGNEGTRFLIDLASIVHDGDDVKVWVQTFRKSNLKSPRTTKGKTKSTKVLWKFQCKYKKMIELSYNAYDARGVVLYTHSDMDNSYMYQDVVPDTVGDDVMNVVCIKGAAEVANNAQN